MPIHTNITLVEKASPADTTIIIGRLSRLKKDRLYTEWNLDKTIWMALLNRLRPSDNSSIESAWVGERKIIIGALPENCSRHNTPTRSWGVGSIVSQGAGRKGSLSIICLVDDSHAEAIAMAVARSIPLYNRCSGSKVLREAQLEIKGTKGSINRDNVQIKMDAVREAALLVDMPCSELNVSEFRARAEALASIEGVSIDVVAGEDLRENGFGGIWNVGKAAADPPAMVIMKWEPKESERHVGWIGKGIVYDTGGLSIKSKTGMPGMKGDMGGAAAVYGAFKAAILCRVKYAITAILCLAENAVGPNAVRPDDVVEMKSGKTVEINNTDAEGRLVLSDGIAWAAQNTDADPLIDIATLTGAAPVSVGKQFAALYCNDEEIERAAVRAGKESGEPCFALPYAPELFRREFSSRIADMKNSVKDRANAQSACAGQFIGNHLPDNPPRWLHIDIAGPAWDRNKMGTGFGVGLLLSLGAGPI